MPLGGAAPGGLGALGMLLMPAGIVVMMLKQPPGPVAKLIAAGAVSPETARRCEGLGIPRAFVLDPAIRRGVVHRTSDGRHWVDVDRARRVRRRTALLAGTVTALVIGAGWWLFAPMLAGGGEA
jgi:hypothetical protein